MHNYDKNSIHVDLPVLSVISLQKAHQYRYTTTSNKHLQCQRAGIQKTKYHTSKQKNIDQENNTQERTFNLDWQSCWKKNAASMRTSRGRSCTAKLITMGIWNIFYISTLLITESVPAIPKNKSSITDFIYVILLSLEGDQARVKLEAIL